MKLTYCKDQQDFIKQVNLWCRDKVQQYKARSLYVPAGNTPTPIYDDWEKNQPEWLQGLRLIQVDEVTQGPSAGLFTRFFQTHLPKYSVIPPAQSRGELADLAMLGLGTNGHVAFHEPHIPRDFIFGSVSLDPGTIRQLQLKPGDQALSYGVGAFMKSKAIVLLISGKGKEDAFWKLIEGQGNQPANFLRSHSDFSVIVNAPRGSELGA